MVWAQGQTQPVHTAAVFLGALPATLSGFSEVLSEAYVILKQESIYYRLAMSQVYNRCRDGVGSLL